MKKILIVSLAALTITGAVQLADRALTPKQHTVILADGSDPMPFCRKQQKCPTVQPESK